MKFPTDIQKKLAEICRKYPISLAYLFGSSITGHSNKESDIDIAVLLPENLSKEKRFQIRLNLTGDLSKTLKKDVDLVILNDVSSLFFKYIIIKEGQVIYRESEDRGIDFENKTFGSYFDYQPFLNTYNQNYVKANV